MLEGSKENDLITIRITRGDKTEAIDKVLLIENHFRKDKRISIVKRIKTKSEEESEKKNKERKEKYNYILDQNLSLSEIMYNYYQTEILPGIEDKTLPTAKISLADFKRILKEENSTMIIWRTSSHSFSA